MIKRTRFVTIFGILVLATIIPVAFSGCASSAGTGSDTTPLVLDPDVSTGVLGNGITWYIKENAQPARKGVITLVVDAGSLMEDDDQLGIAHFTEHMLFNGTKNFKEHELVDYLQSIGMTFGPDISAYTAFDETIYRLEIPTDDPEKVDTAFQILEDWAHLATMDEKEIDLERLVILEEWRMLGTTPMRITQKWLAELLAGTRYTRRIPIGEPEIFMNLPAERIRAFYEEWYRPDLMAVVAVGDFDTEEIKELIEKHFAHIPAKEFQEDPPVGELIDLPPRVVVLEDPEATSPEVRITSARPQNRIVSEGDLREAIVRKLAWIIFNMRTDELSRSTPPPFIDAGGGNVDIGDVSAFTYVRGILGSDTIPAGVDALLEEIARMASYGVTAVELDIVKTYMDGMYRQAMEEKDSTESGVFEQALVDYHLWPETYPLPGAEKEYQLVHRFLQEISLEEVNRYATTTLPDKGTLMTLIVPEKPEIAEEEKLLELLAGLDAREVAPPREYDLVELPTEHISGDGEVVERNSMEELGAEEWVLSNGARVIVKPTDFKNNEILFYAFSPGGLSQVDDSMYFDGLHSTLVVTSSGLAGLSMDDIQKSLAGKKISISAFIDDRFERFKGESSSEDIELLFRLLRLFFTSPEFDPDMFEVVMLNLREEAEGRTHDPIATYSQEVEELLWDGAYRKKDTNNEIVDSLELEAARKVFTERFAGGGDWEFIFVGNIDVDVLEELAVRYLATLPEGNKEEWIDRNISYRLEPSDKTVYMGTHDAGRITFAYPHMELPSEEDRLVLPSVNITVESMLDREVRENIGGTYDIRAKINVARQPSRTLGRISLGCDPDRIEELTEAVEETIAGISIEGIKEEFIEGLREKYRQDYETNLESNTFWINWISSYLKGDGSMLPLEPEEYNKLLTRERIVRLTNWIFDPDKRLRVILMPEDRESL